MKRLLLTSVAVVLACAASVAAAKKPHPFQEDAFAVPAETMSCSCEFVTVVVEEIIDGVPVLVEKDGVACDLIWEDTAPAYGADVELEYDWMDGAVEMEASTDLELDDAWACDAGMCSADGTSLVPDVVTGDYAVTAMGKVKGFDNAGSKPRDFVKTVVVCTLPAE
jgi:hypothetical protein